ncbi:hypothetical protein EII12_06010 [Buchananella hordeovulneris]|uniref:hypothetical protein n=1 Tax=Buchananella hordeovulneris TaxID=52770 RepID=UPI000F5D9AAC|nr:hypothetical protein [Buchananella hordeovulneris]RRD52097.1 hypothetical protein EII12_06010 [Buchananella hordeovulneris]
MTEQLSPADRDELSAALPHVHLQGITFHEISARQRMEEPSLSLEENSVNLDLAVQQGVGPTNTFGIRLLGKVEHAAGTVTVIVAATYKIADGFTMSSRCRNLYVNEVAIMTAFPYLREGISCITAKVFGDPLLVPVLQRGQLTVPVDEDSDLSEKRTTS